jgi:hypothetical protein
MSELSILELETEHAELLPEREALGNFAFQFGLVNVSQQAQATAFAGAINHASATNIIII